MHQGLIASSDAFGRRPGRALKARVTYDGCKMHNVCVTWVHDSAHERLWMGEEVRGELRAGINMRWSGFGDGVSQDVAGDSRDAGDTETMDKC